MSPNRAPSPSAAAAARARAAAVAASLAASLALGAGAARAQPASPEDWPCVQVLVPELSAAALWPLPLDAAALGDWREDADAAALARRLGELERVDAAALAAIDAFAAGVSEDAREAALSRVAVGTLDVADERRSRYIDGIRRYTRQQIAISRQIEETLNLLADLDDAEAAGTTLETEAPRAEIEETLSWHERLYDQRERAIRALCERPGELEQTLSATLRELAYRLPDA